MDKQYNLAKNVRNIHLHHVKQGNMFVKNSFPENKQKIKYPIFPGNLSGIIAFGEDEGKPEACRVIMAAGKSRAKGLPQVVTLAYYQGNECKSIGTYEFYEGADYKHEEK